jgi:UPF0755 protein
VERGRSRRAILVAAAAVVIAAALAIGTWDLLFRPESALPGGQGVRVVISSDAPSADIARILAEHGVVADSLMFRIRARLAGADGRFQAGTYDLTTGMTYEDAIATLKRGSDTVHRTLTVPEGWTVDQIAARVGTLTGVSAKEFASFAKTAAQDPALLAKYPFLRYDKTPSLEGYLFPKTYQVKSGASAREIVEMMLAQFGREIAAVDMTVPRAHGLDPHQVVTMASMIEREARIPTERQLVASVIYNRLALDMPLEIDATVLYVVGYKTRLLNRDLAVNSPYNTYIVHGLPPGPIASPGLASLEAACSPASTGYLYYVRTGKDGSHTFTATKAEFLAAKEQAKKGLR